MSINSTSKNLGNSDDTIADPDEDDKAGIFSIANAYTSEDENALAEKEDDLLVVRARRPATNKVSQQKNFCWHEKQWSVSYKTPSLKRGTGRNGTLINMVEKRPSTHCRKLSPTVCGKST